MRTVVELRRGQHLYILVGQEGSNGCEVGLVCQLDHRNNIPCVLIYHLSRLYVLVVMSPVYFITYEALASELR